MKLHLYDVVVEPMVTEKSSEKRKVGKYAFRVHTKATKHSIKEAVEKIFNVHVMKINTQISIGKWKRVRFKPGLTTEWKKATVTLKEGEKIEFA